MAKKTKAQMEAMLSDEEEDAEEMVKPLPDWLGKKKDRMTGQYLRVKNGFIYIFKVDLNIQPQVVEKDFQNDGNFKTKHQWKVYLQDIKPTGIGKGLQEDDPEQYKKVMDQNVGIGEEFIFEMSSNIDQQLAGFIFEMADPLGNIKMQRKGAGAKTRYHFSEG